MALFVTFRDGIDLALKVYSLAQALVDEEYGSRRLEWKVIVFCNITVQKSEAILFVIDQANVLDDSIEDRISSDKKRGVRKLLDGLLRST